jgi:hypothetical protein
MLKVWQEAGIDPVAVLSEIAKERDQIPPEQRRSQITGPVRGFIIPTLRSVGLFSERLEGHFRDMFISNFGQERGAALDLDGELPADLDAWVEGRLEI